MLSLPLSSPLCAFINHVLGRDAWARERLQAHAGKTLRVRAGLVDMNLAIDTQGLLQAVAAPERADLLIDIPLSASFGLLQRDQSALRAVAIEGDTDLAETVQFLFLHCRWDIEEDLSRVVGDIAAHRMVAGGRAFMDWQRDTATRLGENLSEYWREEARLLATRSEVQDFGAAVASLRDDLARLEKRLERHS